MIPTLRSALILSHSQQRSDVSATGARVGDFAVGWLPGYRLPYGARILQKLGRGSCDAPSPKFVNGGLLVSNWRPAMPVICPRCQYAAAVTVSTGRQEFTCPSCGSTFAVAASPATLEFDH